MNKDLYFPCIQGKDNVLFGKYNFGTNILEKSIENDKQLPNYLLAGRIFDRKQKKFVLRVYICICMTITFLSLVTFSIVERKN